MIKERYLIPYIIEDLKEKMVFIAGPRQVGKTTLAKKLIANAFTSFTYFNWDIREDRKKIFNTELPGKSELLIFDEIHKYKNWKNYLKGLFDKYNDKYKFLITGSSRLDIYKKGGDSLQGRYHYYRLHPFSLAEILNLKNRIKPFKELDIPEVDYFSDFDILKKFGGFPENIIKQDERNLRRWHNERVDRLFREDIRDITIIKDLSSMQLLIDILPEKVGSLLSINSLREDLEVSHRAVSHWLDILETFYYFFRIYPYNKKRIRSIKKEPKLYLFDWSEVDDEGARLENIVAVHLLKLVNFLYDYMGYKAELNYLRNIDKKEVDFIISVDKKIWFCAEVKASSKKKSNLKYFMNRLDIPFAYTIVAEKNVDKIIDDIRIVSIDKFLASLI